VARAEPESTAVLEVTDLNVGYGNVPVLWKICLRVLPAELVALVGSNGAGKTTLLRALSGLIKTMGGNVSFAGRDITTIAPDLRVGMGLSQVPEGRLLFAGMTVQDNLIQGAFLIREKQVVRQNLERMLEYFPELKLKLKQLAGTLSGGEQQMCAIGRALMIRPKLLLIDEMSLGLAPVIVDRLAKIITRVNQEFRLAVLRVEQDVQMALESCHRGYVIENGRIVLEGDGLRLLADPRIRQAYLGL
jgi:branched-chain amino acid transport system ATP-binding protein